MSLMDQNCGDSLCTVCNPRPSSAHRITVVIVVLLDLTLAAFVAGLFWDRGWTIAALAAACAVIVSVTLSRTAERAAKGAAERTTDSIGGRR